MTPRRDVEEEIYAQLYGEPSERRDPASPRVIDGEHRTRPLPEDPEPEPRRPRRLQALGLAAAAGAQSVKEALRSARARRVGDPSRSDRPEQRPYPDRSGRAERQAYPDRSSRAPSLRDDLESAWALAAEGLGGLGGRERRLLLGALAVALLGLVLIAGLSAGSGERQRTAGPPPGATASQLAAQSATREAREARAAREAREARRRRARRHAAAHRRQEALTVPSSDPAPVHHHSPPPEVEQTEGTCSEKGGCVPQSVPERRPTRADEPEQSNRDTVHRPGVRINFGDRGSRRGGGPAPDVDVDVDVEVPEVR